MKNNKRVISNIMLLLTAFIWGMAFVAQSVGMDYVGPFTFTASRNVVAGIVLIPIIFIMDFMRKKESSNSVDSQEEAVDKSKYGYKFLILGGALCGLALFLGTAFQQYGLLYTTAGKSGFITALYIIIVPLLGIFIGRKVNAKIWVSVGIAVIGFYFLCIKEGVSANKGDLLTLICSFFFSLHILVIDYFSPKVDGVRMSCIQFFVCGIIAIIFSFIFEQPKISNILAGIIPILYAGVLSSAMGYTLQILAQKNTEPVIASLIMSLESVFAVLSGWLILNQALTLKEAMGCVLVFIAIILAQLPSKIKAKKINEINKSRC